MENSASNIPDTTWLLVFWPNGLNGTKFGRCFFIGLDLRDSFSRSLLGENGYFIVFWHFRPNFKLILHTSKWILCKQKFWELFISILGSLQHKFYGHLDCLNRKFIGGVTFTPPRACPINRDPGLNRVKFQEKLKKRKCPYFLDWSKVKFHFEGPKKFYRFFSRLLIFGGQKNSENRQKSKK